MAVGFDAYADRLYSTSSLPGVNTYTVAGWFKIDTTADDGALLAFDDTTGGGVHSVEVTAGAVAFYDNFGMKATVRTMVTGSWYYVALTIGAANEQLLYMKALGESAFVTGSDTAITIDFPWTHMGICGRDIFGSGITGASAYVRSWSRVLSSVELLAESNSTSPVSSTNLVGAWPLDTAASRLSASFGSYLSEPDAGAWTDVASPTLSTPSAAQFTGSISTSTVLSANLSTQINMLGSISSTSTPSAALTTDILFVGSSNASSSTTAVLSTDITMAGSSTSTSSVSAQISTDILMIGATQTSSSLSGQLLTDILIAGSSDAASSLSGQLLTDITMAGSLTTSSTLTANMSTEILMAGSSTSATSVSGDIVTDILLTGGVSAGAAPVADLLTSIQMSGDVQATSSVSGSLAFLALFSGDILASTSLQSSLDTAILMAGDVSSTSTAEGFLYTGTTQIAGSISTSTTLSATLYKRPRGVPESSLYSKYLKNMTPTMGASPSVQTPTSAGSKPGVQTTTRQTSSSGVSPPTTTSVSRSTRPSAPSVFGAKKES